MRARFVVITPGRSGSHLLRTLLQSHPQVRCYGELFNHEAYGHGSPGTLSDGALALLAERDANPRALLRHLLISEHVERATATGLFVLYDQGDMHSNGVLWRTLQEIPDLRVIHLVRHNLLRRLFSLRKAMETGVWRAERNDEARTLRLTLGYAECINDFWRITTQARKVREMFAQRPLLSLAYERLVCDRDRELARVQRFLDVDVRPLVSGAQPQVGLPLEQSIVNFYELRESFAGSEWSWFFDD